MSQPPNAPAPTGGEQAIMEALQKLSEQVQRFQDNLTTHTSQIQGMHQEQSAQFQGLTVQLQKIHEEQSLNRLPSHSSKISINRWSKDSKMLANRSDDPCRRQSVGHARAHNLAARDTPYRRISPKPGKPAYEESDFPANAFKVPFMPEDSCDRLARAWGIEFVEGINLDQKRGEVGRFIGCHTPW